MPFKEIIAVYSENHTTPIKQNVEILTVKAAGKYSYHLVLKAYALCLSTRGDGGVGSHILNLDTIWK
jgi:hypothetical protein